MKTDKVQDRLVQQAIPNCSIIQAVQYFWNSENSGEIRGPLVDQIGAASHTKLLQIGMDEKGFFPV